MTAKLLNFPERKPTILCVKMLRPATDGIVEVEMSDGSLMFGSMSEYFGNPDFISSRKSLATNDR